MLLDTRSFASALILAMGMMFPACQQSEWPERDPLIVQNAPVDSLEFLPQDTRYILQDSLTRVAFRGFRMGYACTEITLLDLERQVSRDSAGFTARLDMELPARPDCAVDSAARDTVLAYRFTAAAGQHIRLLNASSHKDSSRIFATAMVKKGILSWDSLELPAKDTSVTRGRFTYRDTLGGGTRMLVMDSLSTCELLNHAEYERKGDTTKVRFTWVTVDPETSEDLCQGPRLPDFLSPRPARPLKSP